MTNPGTLPKQFICIDPGTTPGSFRRGGSFYEGTFKDLLKHGYLDEGSRWLEKNTGIVHKVIGMTVPLWLPDHMPWKQETEPPILD